MVRGVIDCAVDDLRLDIVRCPSTSGRVQGACIGLAANAQGVQILFANDLAVNNRVATIHTEGFEF
jgi:hypothetical protein